MDLPFSQQVVYHQEIARARVPGPPGTGVQIAGPAIIRHGTDEQRARLLPSLLRADSIWAQGFSEPGAGSDLPSLQTRAAPRGRRLRRDGAEGVELARRHRRHAVHAGADRPARLAPGRHHVPDPRPAQPRRHRAPHPGHGRRRGLLGDLARRGRRPCRQPDRRRGRRLARHPHQPRPRAGRRRVEPGRELPAHRRRAAGERVRLGARRGADAAEARRHRRARPAAGAQRHADRLRHHPQRRAGAGVVGVAAVQHHLRAGPARARDGPARRPRRSSTDGAPRTPSAGGGPGASCGRGRRRSAPAPRRSSATPWRSACSGSRRDRRLDDDRGPRRDGRARPAARERRHARRPSPRSTTPSAPSTRTRTSGSPSSPGPVAGPSWAASTCGRWTRRPIPTRGRRRGCSTAVAWPATPCGRSPSARCP